MALGCRGQGVPIYPLQRGPDSPDRLSQQKVTRVTACPLRDSALPSLPHTLLRELAAVSLAPESPRRKERLSLAGSLRGPEDS